MTNQSQTPHAKALSVWTGTHFAGRRLRERGGTEYEFTAEGVRITRGGESIAVPIRWAFGSGVQAITPVIEKDGKQIEHRLSWYRQGDRLGLSPGHSPNPAADLNEALGIEQTDRNVNRCFGCHTTAGNPGVGCESCHAKGDYHVRAPSAKNIGRDRSVALCATCHRSPDATFQSSTPEIEDERNMRFAPVGFLASRCYRASKSFTCVTCHDPHGEPAKMTTQQVCTSCHAVVAKSSNCPRTPDCAGCHMPSSSPMPGLRFTDHRIRIR